MWILHLNDMRESNYEVLSAAAAADTRQELVDLVASEKVEPWRDGRWAKTFRRGGILEWFNEPSERSFFDMGTFEECVARVREKMADEWAKLEALKAFTGNAESVFQENSVRIIHEQ